MPPSPAGASLLANDDADRGHEQRTGRQVLRDRPGEADRSRDVGHGRAQDDQRCPAPVGLLDLVDDAGEVGELREQEVGGQHEHHGREDRLPADPLELGELDVLDAALLDDLGLHVLEQALVFLERRLGGAAQCRHLQAGKRLPTAFGADRLDRRTHGSFGADDHGERGQHLRNVSIEDLVGDSEFGEAEVDQPRHTVVCTKMFARRRSRWAMRCSRRIAICSQTARINSSVTVVVGDTVERGAVDHLVGEQHRVLADIDDAAEAGGPDADVACDQRNEGLVFDRAAKGGERPIVTDVLQPEEAVDAESRSAARSWPPRTLTNSPVPSVEGGEVRRGSPGVDLGGVDFRDRQTGTAQAGTDGPERRMPIRATEQQEHGGTDRRSDGSAGTGRPGVPSLTRSSTSRSSAIVAMPTRRHCRPTKGRTTMNIADSWDSCTTPFNLASPRFVPVSSSLTTAVALRSMSASMPDIAANVVIAATAT